MSEQLREQCKSGIEPQQSMSWVCRTNTDTQHTVIVIHTHAHKTKTYGLPPRCLLLSLDSTAAAVPAPVQTSISTSRYYACSIAARVALVHIDTALALSIPRSAKFDLAIFRAPFSAIASPYHRHKHTHTPNTYTLKHITTHRYTDAGPIAHMTLR